MTTEKKHIYVTGDVAMDTNIYKGIRHSPEIKEYGTFIDKQDGGSNLLYKIVYEVSSKRKSSRLNELVVEIQEKKKELKNKKPNESEEIEKIKGKIAKLGDEKSIWQNTDCKYGLKTNIFNKSNLSSSLKTFAAWDIKKYDTPKSFQNVLGEETKAWKVSEMVGWGKVTKNEKAFLYNDFIPREKHNSAIIVFDDGGNNFRNDKNAWKNLLEENKGIIEHVIFKTAYPLGRGSLFHKLISDFRDKLTIITSIHEIRKEDVLISKGLSWEQTALDLVSELCNNRAIKRLLDGKRLIVTFQSEGALYIEMDDKEEIMKCRLIFDPEHLEGEWETAKNIEGNVFGLMSSFTAAITLEFQEALVKYCIKQEKKIDDYINLESAVTSGLSAMRLYKITGHGSDVNSPGFPFESICSEIISPNSKYASAFVPIPKKGEESKKYIARNWTILEGNYKPADNEKAQPLFDTAFRFALHGDGELSNTPSLKINNLITYDRREIEALRNIRNLIMDYIADKNPGKPLSLAVFGMPGSGKSFAVKQLAKALERPFLEFNLSQFEVGELEGAFHQVRDKVLKGKTPIVFWDEFDSQAYKWLQYLLAPMQDGMFQEGQITHPIGKSIFIFAGGTSYTFDTFGVEEPKKPKTKNATAIKIYESALKKYDEFKLKKGPDFKSRLSGYLNVMGPNQLEKLDEFGKIIEDVNGNVEYDETDIQYPVRRALFMRGILRLESEKELKIDYGLLNALIKNRKFTHGSRSLEKTLSYLKLKNSNKLQRSNLPSASILHMLVANDFMDFLNEEKALEFQAYKIAPQIHQNWKKLGDTQGWKLEYHKDFNYLPAHMKDENIAAARRIQNVLDALKPEQNLKIIPKDEAEFYDGFTFSDYTNTDLELSEADRKRNLEFMDLMAKEEHKGWVETKENTGWVFGKPRNDDKKIHNCIIDWDEEEIMKDGTKEKLSENDKNKDKDAIKNYADVLVEAGFVIVEEKA